MARSHKDVMKEIAQSGSIPAGYVFAPHADEPVRKVETARAQSAPSTTGDTKEAVDVADRVPTK